MPIDIADAVTDLRNTKDVYKQVKDRYAETMTLVKEAARGTTDPNYSFVSSIALVQAAHAQVGVSFELPITDALREFKDAIGTSSDDPDTILQILDDYMIENSIEIKSRGAVYGAEIDNGGNGGDQTLMVCSKRKDNVVHEAVTVETLTFKCARQAANRGQLGLEVYTVRGENRAGLSEFDGPGRGIADTTMIGTGPGRSAWLKNASFDLPFNGSGNDKVQFWDIIAGASNIAEETTQIAEDRGLTHRSIKISGTMEMEFNFRKQNIALSRVAPYVSGFRILEDCTGGTLIVRVGITGAGTYTKTHTLTGVAGWQTIYFDPDVDDAWVDTFDTDGEPVFSIECTVAPTGGNSRFYVDDLVFEPMKNIGGRWCSIGSGLLPALKDDSHTHAVTLTVGSGSVALTGGAAGSIDSITLNTADMPSLSLLTAVIPFNGSLAQTAQDAVDNINANQPTYPRIIASRVSNTIVLTPVDPFIGTITVTSSCTTITKTDTDITGGAIGYIQDMLIRRTGRGLRHASSATSGWDD